MTTVCTEECNILLSGLCEKGAILPRTDFVRKYYKAIDDVYSKSSEEQRHDFFLQSAWCLGALLLQQANTLSSYERGYLTHMAIKETDGSTYESEWIRFWLDRGSPSTASPICYMFFRQALAAEFTLDAAMQKGEDVALEATGLPATSEAEQWVNERMKDYVDYLDNQHSSSSSQPESEFLDGLLRNFRPTSLN